MKSSAPNLLILFIVVSVVLRLGSAAYQGSSVEMLPGVTDEVSYHTLAVRLLEGHGFSFGTGWWPATAANEPTAHWSFLYVLFLAGIYAVTGPVPLVARLAQALIVGVLHPWLVWRIGNRLFGPVVGLAATAITAVYGYFVYYAGALVTESLYMVAVLSVLDIATVMVSPQTHGRAAALKPWWLLGLAAAAATLLRQAFLLMLPVVVAWTAWQLLQRRSPDASPGLSPLAVTLRGAAACAVVVAAILPWTIRNYQVFDQFVPLNTNAGFVMFWGNHPVHGTSFKPILSYGIVNYGTMLPDDVTRRNEAALDRELLRRGFAFVKDDPVRYARLSLSRAVEYFKFWPSVDSSLGSNIVRVLSFGLLLPFLVGGAVLALRRSGEPEPHAGMWLLLLVAALYSVVHLLTWTLIRYRLPVDAMMMPFAGLALVTAARRLRSIPMPLQAPASRRADGEFIQPGTS